MHFLHDSLCTNDIPPSFFSLLQDYYSKIERNINIIVILSIENYAPHQGVLFYYPCSISSMADVQGRALCPGSIPGAVIKIIRNERW